MPFIVQRPKEDPINVIRPATANELRNYEKHKLQKMLKNIKKDEAELLKIAADKLIYSINLYDKNSGRESE